MNHVFDRPENNRMQPRQMNGIDAVGAPPDASRALCRRV